MPTYHYRARDRQGTVSEAEMQAASPSAVAAELRRQGMWATSIREVTGPRPEDWQTGLWHSLRPPSAAASGQFLAQLSSLLGSGINAHDAMGDLAERTADRRLRRAAAEMAQGLAAGSSLGAQLGRYPNLFPPHIIGGVTAAESFGGVPEVVRALAGQLGTEAMLQSRLMWLRLYYGAVLVLAVLVVPFPLMVAKGMRWYIMLELTRVLPVALVLVGALLLVRALTNRPPLSAVLSRAAMGVPLFGALARWSALVRFLTALQLSQRAGATLDRGIVAGGQATGHAHLLSAAERSAERVRSGAGLAQALPALGLLPVHIINLLATGERAGTLEEALGNAAQWAEERRLASVNAISSGAAAGALGVAAVLTLIALALAYTNLYRAMFERAGVEW